MQWGKATRSQGAFEDMKRALTSKPVLRPPDMAKDFEIWSDSSKSTLSAMLTERGGGAKDDLPWVVSQASRKLLDRECNYFTVERELLSVNYFCSYQI